MRSKVAVCLGGAAVVLTLLVAQGSSLAKEPPQSEAAEAADAGGLQLETLLSAQLAGVEGVEVIVSRVTVPPNTALPKHWHPGEEFAYVLEGSAVLWQDGKEDTALTQGDAVEVPLRQVHTAISGDDGATFLVFRVHAEGQPERTLVE